MFEFNYVWNIHLLGFLLGENLEDTVNVILGKIEKHDKISLEREDWVFQNSPAVTLKLKLEKGDLDIENNSTDKTVFDGKYQMLLLDSTNWGREIEGCKLIIESTNLNDKPEIYLMKDPWSETYFWLGSMSNRKMEFLFKSADGDFKKVFEENAAKMLEIHLIQDRLFGFFTLGVFYERTVGYV